MAQVESKSRATSSTDDRKEVLKRIKDEGVEFLLLWFTDLEGHLKSFAVTPSEMEAALDDGMGFDGSSITGFNAIEESDMVAIPDPRTFQLMPWREGETKVARMICDVVTPDGAPYDGDPRFVLRRALDRMKEMGFDTFNIGPELEYFLFKDSKGTETLDEGGYFAMTTMDAAGELRQETVRALEGMGIPIEYVHHEVGPSQHEIDMRFAPALEMADHTITYRLIVKEIAKKAGFHATFMPKPIFGENGSGMHTHMSLFTDGRNQFFDADDKWHLSDVGKAFIAGQLRHAREISAIFAQWVNSYKRLVPGYEAPVYVAWSQRNRSALIRIPLYKPGSEEATRAEIRCPDPACNPYLTFAALLHAGLEGIEKGYELPEPMETNLYHLTPEQRRERGIVSLPETLGEAIDELSGVRAGAQDAGTAHLRPVRRAEAQGVGRLPGAADAVGARALPAGPLVNPPKSRENVASPAPPCGGWDELTADCELRLQLVVVLGPLEKRANRLALDVQSDDAAGAVDLLNRLCRHEPAAAREEARTHRESVRRVTRASVHGALDPADDLPPCVRDQIADRLAKVGEHRDGLAQGWKRTHQLSAFWVAARKNFVSDSRFVG